MRNFLLSFLIIGFTLGGAAIPFGAFAQDAANPDEGLDVETAEAFEDVAIAAENQPLVAVAGKDRNVVVGHTVLFDGSGTTPSTDDTISYRWDFGDGSTAIGVDAAHVYDQSGTYRVQLVAERVSDDGIVERSTDEIFVSVQDQLVLLVTDQSVTVEEIQSLQEYGLTQGVLVVPIRDSGVDQDYLVVQQLAQQILEQEEDLISSDMIITWTTGDVGLNALVEVVRVAGLNDRAIEDFRLGSKTIVAVANGQALSASARFAQRAYQSLQPSYIVVADEDILDDAVAAASPEALEQALPISDATYQLITPYTERGLGNIGPFNFMSHAMAYMINNGVPANSLFLILMLPVLATIIAIGRQFVGIKAFGIFAPTVIALSFLATGLKYGLAIFAVVTIVGTLARLFARKLRIMYMPRMAIVLSIVAMSIFLMFLIGAYTDRVGFIAISIFPILIMTVLTEHFISVQIEQGVGTAVKLTLETLALSIIGFWIADWTWLRTTILAYPELILLTFVINYALGKFTGLRLTEYLRFRNVFKAMSNAKKS